jgi:hypothetical protein
MLHQPEQIRDGRSAGDERIEQIARAIGEYDRGEKHTTVEERIVACPVTRAGFGACSMRRKGQA